MSRDGIHLRRIGLACGLVLSAYVLVAAAPQAGRIMNRTTTGVVQAPAGYVGPSAAELRGFTYIWIRKNGQGTPRLIRVRDERIGDVIILAVLNRFGPAFVLDRTSWALRGYCYLLDRREFRDAKGNLKVRSRPKTSDIYEVDFEVGYGSSGLKMNEVRLVGINGKAVFTRTPPGREIP